MDKPHTSPRAKTTKVRTQGADVDAAWLWYQGTLRHLPPDLAKARLHSAPALEVLLAYQAAVLSARKGPES